MIGLTSTLTRWSSKHIMRYMLAVIKSVPEKVTWFPVHSIIVRWNSIWCMDKESALMHKNFVEVLSRPFACVTITRSVRHHVLAVFIKVHSSI